MVVTKPSRRTGTGKTRSSPLRRWWVVVAAAVLLVVPMIALGVAGFAWLWEHGWAFWWLGGAAAATLLAWLGLRARHRPFRGPPSVDEGVVSEADIGWAPKELKAWEEVRRLSLTADVSILKDRALMLDAARQTIEAVAAHYHPGREDPTLEFTVPELLLLTERVSSRTRKLLLEHVPYSHRLKAGHLLRAWSYHPMLSSALMHGRNLYTVLRVIRGVSPIGALVAELRDYVVDDLFESLQAHVRTKIVKIWIEEVGRAAIELYSGRLRVDAEGIAAAAAVEGLGGAAAALALPGALRLLVAGRTNAGKSTLVNTLLGGLHADVDVQPTTTAFEGYELREHGTPAAFLIDSPGLDDPDAIGELTKRAFVCDLILWVVPTHVDDRALDAKALAAMRARFAEDPQRSMPPVVIVANHVDRLEALKEWAPPYNVDAPSTPEEQALRARLDGLAADLDVAIDTIVPMRLDGPEPYNVDLLRLKLAGSFGEAQRARWIRIQREATSKRSWRRTWKQVTGAGRMVGGLVKP
jgi:uncharacterized protein